MISIQEMKKLRDIISDRFGVSPSVAGRVIGYYNGSGRGDMVAAMIAGDLSGVGPALAALGVNISENTPEPSTEKGPAAGDKITETAAKTARNASRGKEKKTSATCTAPQDQYKSGVKYAVQDQLATSPALEPDQLETVAGEMVPADYNASLPDGIADMVYSALDTFCNNHNFEDLQKARQTAWSSACRFIGQAVFRSNRRILLDAELSRASGGGFCYDFKKLNALADLYIYLCGIYTKAPTIDDFSNFSGCDETTIYMSGAKHTDVQRATPARVQLLQKLHKAQEAGLAALIVDGRQNPTGALAALNHWHGWTQTREIIHTAGQGSQTAAALPVFDSGVGILPDKSVQ